MSVATTYAEALYEAAVDAGAVPQVAADVEAFADANPLVQNFLQVLVERGRIAEFLEIAEAFRERVARAEARLDVEAVTAIPLPDDLRERIVERLQAKTNATIELTESVDPDVVGGLVLRVGEVVVDGSVRNRIEELRRELSGVPVDAAVVPA